MARKSPSIGDAIRWIRKHCRVDTGSGIYGDADQYTYTEILDAIKQSKGKPKDDE
jgi:hypothetical protein